MRNNKFFIPAVTINQSARDNSQTTDGNPSQKSWIATLLLCLFGGHIGLHRFYTGKIVTGIAFLFTMGGFGFGYIIGSMSIK